MRLPRLVWTSQSRFSMRLSNGRDLSVQTERTIVEHSRLGTFPAAESESLSFCSDSPYPFLRFVAGARERIRSLECRPTPVGGSGPFLADFSKLHSLLDSASNLISQANGPPV